MTTHQTLYRPPTGTGPLAPSRDTPHLGLCSGEGRQRSRGQGGLHSQDRKQQGSSRGGTCSEPWETELGEERHRYLEEGMLESCVPGFLHSPATVVRPPAADREKVKPCSARVLPPGPRPAESSCLLDAKRPDLGTWPRVGSLRLGSSQ